MGDLTGSTADGTTISVEQKGTGLRFLLEGVEYLAIPDGAVANQLQGGMIAAEDSTGEARWNRFLVMVYPDDESAPTDDGGRVGPRRCGAPLGRRPPVVGNPSRPPSCPVDWVHG